MCMNHKREEKHNICCISKWTKPKISYATLSVSKKSLLFLWNFNITHLRHMSQVHVLTWFSMNGTTMNMNWKVLKGPSFMILTVNELCYQLFWVIVSVHHFCVNYICHLGYLQNVLFLLYKIWHMDSKFHRA